MRILIISDTHGRTNTIRDVLDTVGDIDMFIHLGDVCGDEEYIYDNVTCPIHMVAGNNDWDSDLPMQEEFMIGRYKVFITHGHRYSVHYGTDRLQELIKYDGYDIVMYGHTHVPYLEEDPDDITILNPGSISKPRQADHRYTYMVMEIDDEDEVTYELRYVE